MSPQETREPREVFLQRAIDVFHRHVQESKGADRAQALRAEYFLRSMIRDAGRPLTDVVEVFRQIAKVQNISAEFRSILHGFMSENIVAPSELRIVLPPPSFPEGAAEEGIHSETSDPDERDIELSGPATFGLAGGVRLSSPDRGDIPGVSGEAPILDLDGHPISPNRPRAVGTERVSEELDSAERDQRAQRAQLARYAKESREFARRYFDRVLPRNVSVERVAENVQSTLTSLLIEGEYLLEHFEFDVGVVRNTLDEDFFAAYFDAVTRAGEERVEFNDKLRLYIGLRGRLGYLLGREAQSTSATEGLTFSQILGVAEGATRDDIEGAYISRLRVLNPDVPEDAASIAMIHKAREQALYHLDLPVSSPAEAALNAVGVNAADWDDRAETVIALPISHDPNVHTSPAVSSGNAASLGLPFVSPHDLSTKHPDLWKNGAQETSAAHELTAGSRTLPEWGVTVPVSRVVGDLDVERTQADSSAVPRYTLADLPEVPWASGSNEWEDEGQSAHVSLPKDVPHYVLGVPKDADRATIERAYSAATEMLDFDRREDRREIADLQIARERMLYRLEHPRQTAVVPQTSVETAQVVPTVAEGRVERVFRAPGRLLRALFAGSVLAAGVGIAVHEFPENDSDAPSVTDTGSDSGRGDTADGAQPGAVEVTGDSGVFAEAIEDMDDGEPTPPAFEAPLVRKYLTPESLRHEGDSVWNVVIDMLRDRGLSTSHPQVQYFTHKALVHNDLTALTAKDMDTKRKLDFTGIAHEMDELLEGEDAAAPSVTAEAQDLPAASVTIDEGGVQVEQNAEVRDSSVETLRPMKAYESLPTADHAEHVMVKGESVYKLVHRMLRSRGLNWTTERINFLTQLVVDKNVDRFREMVADGRMRGMNEEWIPAGAVLDFSDAVAVVDDMERAKKAGKKAKTVKELAGARGYKYPIMMKFPKE